MLIRSPARPRNPDEAATLEVADRIEKDETRAQRAEQKAQRKKLEELAAQLRATDVGHPNSTAW